MTKYFGQHLVSKKIISEDILIETLVEQLSALPSVIEIVYQKKLTTNKIFLDILVYQMDNKVEFKQACLVLGVWSDQIENDLQEEIQKIRIPLGHLLIKKGVVNLEVITRELDEFLSKKEIPSVAVSSVSVISSPPARIFIQECINYLAGLQTSHLNTHFENIRSNLENKNMIESTLKQILVEFNILKGHLRMINLHKVSLTISIVQNFFETLSTNIKILNGTQLQQEINKSEQVIYLILNILKEQVMDSKSEEQILENLEIKNNLEKLKVVC